MKATHTDYMHPRHLRVEHEEKDASGGVWCVAPGSELYRKLNRSGLPKYALAGFPATQVPA